MKKTRQIIDENIEDFPEFQYYHAILDKIEENAEQMPDIAIESCKALFEGISKTILKKFKIEYIEKGRGTNTPKELWDKVIITLSDDVLVEPEFLQKTGLLIARISEIRNERGDISHGKASPKGINSNKDLAEFIIQVTDSLIHYLLKRYFQTDTSYLELTQYEENPEFNEYLDSESEFTDILYSRALFDQDPTAYEEKLNNYLAEINEE